MSLNVVQFPKPNDHIAPHLRELADAIEAETECATKAVFILAIDEDGDLSLTQVGRFSNLEFIGSLKVAEAMIMDGMDYD
jgi:hypothetical protein